MWKILQEDDYQEILNIADAKPGDVLVYYKNSAIDHTAIVVQEPDPMLQIPRVIAKWAAGPEVIHYANYGGYDFSTARLFRVK